MKNIETKGKFNIKLLAGNNVTLVEANGYDSEIFVPQIINGRIALVNIVPNRRCCQPQTARIKSASCCGIHSKDQTNHNLTGKVNTYRAQGGQEEQKNVDTIAQPLACSTPINYINHRHHQMGKKRHQIQDTTNTRTKTILKQNNNENTPLTPEAIREAAPTANLNGTILQLPNHSKSVKFSRQSSKGDSTTQQTDVGEKGNGGGGGNGVGGTERLFRTPSPISTPLSSPAPSAIQSASLRKVSSYTVNYNNPIKSPNSNEIDADNTKRIENIVSNNAILSPPLPFMPKDKYSPETKWRKVITPMRTYSRKTAKKISPKAATILEAADAAKRLAVTSEIVPPHFVNSTQGKKGTHRLEIRKRRLIVDRKTIITPQKHDKNNKVTATTTKRSRKQQRHKQNNKKAEGVSTFDILSNSNRYQQRPMSKKLQQQFRKSCINKTSSTCEEYKFLCANITPLNEFNSK